MATIRRVPHLEHNFQLVITRVYEEGDQELLEDEEEIYSYFYYTTADEERVFLISEELEFRTSEIDGEPTFIWRDLEGDIDEMYQYVASGTNAPTNAFFETCMYRAMYERKYKLNPDDVKDVNLDEFMWNNKCGPIEFLNLGPPTIKKPAARRKVAKAPSTSSVEEILPPAPAPADKGKSKAESSFLDSMTPMISTEAELYYWEADEQRFENQGIVTAQIVAKPGTYQFWVTASTEEGMNPLWSAKMHSFTWNFVKEDETADSWLFRFPAEEVHANFMQIFTRCAWESLHQAPWDKLKEDERNYVLSSASEDVEMKDVEDEEDEEEVLEELDPEIANQGVAERSDTEEEDEDIDPEDKPPQLAGDANSQLVVGYKGDRS
ncbi:hypothetical protein MPER_10915, partial [Moniliophthora perniciosa FA553]